MKLFDNEERTAFARIISDLIEADFIVEEYEMDSFDEIKNDKDFKITMRMLSDAKTMTFADAVRVLQQMRDKEKNRLIREKLYKMSLSDGTCVPLEALQILAVNYALEGKGQVYSIPASNNSFIDNMKVLYIEDEDNTETDAYIRSNYRAISNEFRLAGFDFVYIPQIVEDYRQIRGEYLHKVITYMMPTLCSEKVEKIQHDLCTMTTSRFRHELLYKKMGINMLSSKPAFLIKIGESEVTASADVNDLERSVYSNFLLIQIDKIGNGGTILEHVIKLMDSYRSMVSGKLIIETRPIAKKFLYYGFHRSLFNLIAYGKERVNYKLVINLRAKKNRVVLRPVNATLDSVVECKDDLPIAVGQKPHALYILMICMSLAGKGLDWTDYGEGKVSAAQKILKKFNTIYYELKMNGDYADEYREKVWVSKTNKEFKKYENIVANIELFIPEKIKGKSHEYYNVPVSSDSVYVIEGKPGEEKEVNIMDSELWKRL